MNRRDFLKTTGLTLTSLAAGWATAQDTSPDTILGDADARINRHRKTRAILKLTSPDGRALPPDTPVLIEQTGHKFLFGCNIFKLNRCRTPADNAAYAERFAALLNFATLPFYWWNYERERGKPDDARSDEMIQWCKAHAVTTKGHPLAWNYVQPPWLGDDTAEAMTLQMARIERCTRRFAGGIDIWDVVNEAVHYDRPFCKEQAPTLTKAIAEIGIGPYVRRAFAAARAGNPAATLLINDYRTDPAYAETVISELTADAKPMYDVIGIQSHMHGGYWGAEQTWRVCEQHARFSVPLHFTETTVVSGAKSGDRWPSTPEGEQAQIKAVAEFYTVLFSHPAVHAITWWDFTDQGSWQAAPAGLVRDDMTPKPAYDRLMDLVKGKWWTRLDAAVGPQGRADLDGFLGRYKATAKLPGRTITGTFTLDKGLETIDVSLA